MSLDYAVRDSHHCALNTEGFIFPITAITDKYVVAIDALTFMLTLGAVLISLQYLWDESINTLSFCLSVTKIPAFTPLVFNCN